MTSTEQRAVDLLPCPFCGGRGTSGEHMDWIACDDCGATGATADPHHPMTKAEAWNRRDALARHLASTAQPAAQESQEGVWVLMPRVMTDAMREAAALGHDDVDEVYEAVVAARPAAPESQERGAVGHVIGTSGEPSCAARLDAPLPAGTLLYPHPTPARAAGDAVSDEAYALILQLVSLASSADREAAGVIARKLDAALAHQPAGDAADDGLYYLQDSRSYVGNCPQWWCPDGRGYTTRLDEAWRMTKEQAEAQHRSRKTDIPWPCAVIDPLRHPTVDMQDMRRKPAGDAEGRG
jgi:hypothetical protein